MRTWAFILPLLLCQCTEGPPDSEGKVLTKSEIGKRWPFAKTDTATFFCDLETGLFLVRLDGKLYGINLPAVRDAGYPDVRTQLREDIPDKGFAVGQMMATTMNQCRKLEQEARSAK